MKPVPVFTQVPAPFDRFAITPDGDVWSLMTGKQLFGRQIQGYYYLTYRAEDGTQKTVKRAKLVALTFLGPRPEGFVINHIDGNKSHDSVSNLEYCSYSENMQHALDRKLSKCGENYPTSKLTNEQVEYIRSQTSWPRGSKQAVAEKFGVSPALITNILKGTSRKHG